MTKLHVDGAGIFEVPEGTRLVIALERIAGQDQLHSCGGSAKCTTCRVEFVSGEPTRATVAEVEVLRAKSLLGARGVRLSCQMTCDHDMHVKVISRLAGSTKKDTGTACQPQIEPAAVWIDMPPRDVSAT